jgi:flagellar basal-body rod protein FlgC
MDLEPLFSTMNTSKSGLVAQRKRLDAIAQNLANIETTRTADGGPYRRKTVSFEEVTSPLIAPESESASQPAGGVVARVREDASPFPEVYDPSHPDADSEGFVKYPNVDIVTEMTELISATRAFDANATAFNAAKQMARKALEL